MSQDHHEHDHGEAHGAHGQSHIPTDSQAFAIGVALNLAFVVLEVVYGFLSNSLALLADAGHHFSDVIGLLLAWSASSLASRVPTKRFTCGLRSTTILAALGNAVLLLVAIGIIIWEAIGRISHLNRSRA